jgi:hypothetical protein
LSTGVDTKFHQLKVNETIGEGIMLLMINIPYYLAGDHVAHAGDHVAHDPLSDGFVHFQLVKFAGDLLNIPYYLDAVLSHI